MGRQNHKKVVWCFFIGNRRSQSACDGAMMPGCHLLYCNITHATCDIYGNNPCFSIIVHVYVFSLYHYIRIIVLHSINGTS